MPTLTGQGDLLEQALLERLEANLDGAEDHDGAGALRPDLLAELAGVVGHEVARVPVTLEDGVHLPDDVRVPGLGHTDVPFEAARLGRLGEVRGADVGGRETRAAMEEPGLGVQPRRGRVVGHANLGASIAKDVQGIWLSRPGVGGRQHPEGSPCSAVRAKSLQEGRNAAPTDERHHDVDPVGRPDLLLDLVPDPRLARGVGQQRGVEERDQRGRYRLGQAVRLPARDEAQHLARRSERFGASRRVRQGGFDLIEQRSGEADRGHDALALRHRLERAMDDAAQMEGNPVRGFGGPQCGLLWLEALGEVSQSSGEGLGDQQLVEPSTEAWHAGILCSSC